MNCKEFSNLLDAYLDGALPREQAAQMENHAAVCGDCASLLTLRQDLRRLDEETEAPPEFSSAWRRMIREDESMEENKAPRRKQWIPYLAAAAALVFIVGGTALTRDSLPRAATATQETAAFTATSARSSAKMDAGMGLMASGAAANVMYDDYAVAEEAEYDMAMEAPSPMAAESTAARKEKIIRSASFSIRTTDYDADLEGLQALTDRLGGRVEYMNLSGDISRGQTRAASLTLRIPSEKLDEFLAGAQQIGSVTDMTQEMEDVSDSYYDIQSRLETQREKLKRLQALMASAEDVSDLIEIESAVADAQYYIDRYTSQLKSYDGRVDYSTVRATVREVKVTEMKEVTLGERIGEGIRDSLSAFGEFLEDMAVFLAAALPWLAAAALVIVLWVIIRKRKKAKKAKKAD